MNNPENLISKYAVELTRAEQQFTFIYTLQFCASWCAIHYDKLCMAGEQEKLSNPPIEDAMVLSQKIFQTQTASDNTHIFQQTNSKLEVIHSEEDFINSFVIHFCTVWTAQCYENACLYGRHGSLSNPPVEDAVFLAKEIFPKFSLLLSA